VVTVVTAFYLRPAGRWRDKSSHHEGSHCISTWIVTRKAVLLSRSATITASLSDQAPQYHCRPRSSRRRRGVPTGCRARSILKCLEIGSLDDAVIWPSGMVRSQCPNQPAFSHTNVPHARNLPAPENASGILSRQSSSTPGFPRRHLRPSDTQT